MKSASKKNECADRAQFACGGKSQNIWYYMLLGAVGAVTGFANGFFGGGGGMLLVPALAAVMKLGEKQSHATAIAVILPLSAVSAAVYAAKGISAGAYLSPITAGVVAGGIIGAVLLSKLSGKAIGAIFYIVMIVAGIKMFIG